MKKLFDMLRSVVLFVLVYYKYKILLIYLSSVKSRTRVAIMIGSKMTNLILMTFHIKDK